KRLAIKLVRLTRGGHCLNNDVVGDLNVNSVSQRINAGDYPNNSIPGGQVERLRVIGRPANPDPCLLTFYHYDSTAGPNPAGDGAGSFHAGKGPQDTSTKCHTSTAKFKISLTGVAATVRDEYQRSEFQNRQP